MISGIKIKSWGDFITPAIKYVTDVIPAKAGIQKDTGCRIMSGMTGFGYLAAGLISDATLSLQNKKYYLVHLQKS